MCICESSLGVATDPDTLTITHSPTSVLIQQSGSVYSVEILAELVKMVHFEYGPASPDEEPLEESYQAVIMAWVSDGELMSQPAAYTTVRVNVMNEASRTLLDGQVRHQLI